MLRGDISNQGAPVYVFDFDDLFVPRNLNWFNVFMLKASKGWWMTISPTHRVAPGALNTLNALSRNTQIYFLMLDKKWSSFIARKVLDAYNVPNNRVDILDPNRNLIDYLIEMEAVAFYTSNVTRRYDAGKLGMPLIRWRDLIRPVGY